MFANDKLLQFSATIVSLDWGTNRMRFKQVISPNHPNVGQPDPFLNELALNLARIQGQRPPERPEISGR